jgi:uncharacterized protein (TIGR02266 family)
MAANKRYQRRHRRRLPVRYRASGSDYRSAFSADVSSGGLFVASTHVLNPGTQVLLDIDLPGLNTTISAMGVVAWGKRVPASLQTIGRGGFGVQFLNVPESWRQYMFQLETTSHAAS